VNSKVLFLEEVGERPYRIDRMLTQLQQSGCLDGVAAVLLGEFRDCDPTPADGAGYEGYEVARDFFTARQVPVAWGFPFGHGKRSIPLRYGATVRLAPERAELEFR